MSVEFSDYRLGKHNNTISLSSSDENHDISVALATQAERCLDVVSRSLDPSVYTTIEFSDAVKDLALKSRHARVRIVVLEPNSVVSRGHRLIELAGRLRTFIDIRTPGFSHRRFNQALCIANGVGVIHRLLFDRYDGVANFNDRPLACELLHQFDNLWGRASMDPTMRRLSL